MSVEQNIFEKNKIYHGDCLEVVIFSTLERWSMKCHVAGSASQMYKRAKFN
jgi:hypothetical protein